MKQEDLSTFSDVLFYLERRGIEPDHARDIVMQVFNWGVSACMDRMRASRPVPDDAPKVEAEPEQFSLTGEPPPKRKRQKKPTQIARTWPDDFVLTDELIKFATERGFSMGETHMQWDKFRDRNKAKAEQYSDWDAAWRTWIRNKVEWKNKDIQARNTGF